MLTTLNTLSPLITEETKELSLEQLSAEYKETLNPSLLATAFLKTYKLAATLANNYIGLSEDDVASFSLEKLDYCMLNYNELSQAKFSSYYGTVLKNKFREETESLNTHKRKIMFFSESYDKLLDSGYDVVISDTEILESPCILKSLELTEREASYCKYIIEDFSNKEIASVLGVSQMTLSNIRKKLRIKLAPLALNN